MTTIVYHDGIIAADSQTTSYDIAVNNNCNKIIKNNGVVFATCGSVTDYEEIIKAYFGKPYNKNIDANAIIDDRGVVYYVGVTEEGVFWKQDVTKLSYCIGSGKWHAWTALDCGCDAKGAVAMAMKRDIYTGGKIRIHKVKP